MNVSDTKEEENYWSDRYANGLTGWDVGRPSTPLKMYIDQLENNDVSILIPGAGNAYEAEYLWSLGFKNIFVLDISGEPLESFSKRCPSFPKSQLIQSNFFEHQATYDLILEQTFFCSFPPTKENRQKYAQKTFELLKPNGRLVGVWFDMPLTGGMVKRPFGGSVEEYLTYFEPYFKSISFERCYNSIKPRSGSELFGILKKI